MTLRWRLVLALTALVTVGLATFGVVTYELYARSLYDRTDAQLRSSVSLVTSSLFQDAGLGGGPADHDPEDRRGRPNVVVPPGTYAELRDSGGDVLSKIQLASSSSQPAIPTDLPSGSRGGSFLTVPSTSGSGEWRVYVAETSAFGNALDVAIAIPLDEVSSSLDRLVLIETVAALGLLAILALGSWLILRRGLHPLEEMATTAGSITAGALDQRVEPDDGRTEVGKLGLAINTMLGDLEDAFRERDATEQRLRQFLADASHELRTPLTSIRGFAELFRLGAGEQDHVSLEVMMRRIEEESARMKTLVDDLLLLARLDETRPVEQVPVDLSILAADACSDAVAVAPDRPITLVAPEPLVVQGDRDHLRQAIANIVSNALKYTPEGSPIEVVAARADGRATVAVRDHGPGLAPEALEHVFDRFWQADDARVGWGAGLGLAIVAAIAEEHGGVASVHNADDGGAIFTISLPITDPAP